MQVVSGVAGHLYAPLEPRHAAVLRVGAYNRPFYFLENKIFVRGIMGFIYVLHEYGYEPCVEIHMMGMDGPDEDNRGRRGLELIGTNCIHAGVV